MKRNPGILLPIVLALAACGGGGEDNTAVSDKPANPQLVQQPTDNAARKPLTVDPIPGVVMTPIETPADKTESYTFKCWDRNNLTATIMVYHDASAYPWKTMRIVVISGADLMTGQGVGDVRLRDDPDGDRIAAGNIVDRGNGVFATGLEPPRAPVYGPADPAIFERPYPTVYFFKDTVLQEVRLEWHNQSYNSDLRCFTE